MPKRIHFNVGGVPEHFNLPWKKAIEELEKVDFTYGTIEFYYDYYEHKYEHLSLTSFTKGDDLKSLIFDINKK